MTKTKLRMYVHRCIIAVVFVFSQLYLLIPPSFVYADPATDVQSPVLQATLKDGEHRNNVTFALTVTDEHPRFTTIEVLNQDDSPLSPRIWSEGVEGAATASLTWRTTDTDDGAYKVRYEAVDVAGNITTETHNFAINNAQPLVTLNDVADGRTVTGLVSRSDVTFQIKFDSVKKDLSPIVAQSPDSSGMYPWTLAVPSDIIDGKYMVEVVATSFIKQQSSLPAVKEMTLQTPLVVTNPIIDDKPLPVVIIPEYAQEVGQFIAPSIPVVPETKLYGVSTTDITEDTSSNERTIASPQRTTAAVLGSGIRSELPRDATPIIATESGWMFFGIAWYWWCVAALSLTGAIVFAIKALRREQSKNIFASAESI